MCPIKVTPSVRFHGSQQLQYKFRKLFPKEKFPKPAFIDINFILALRF